MLPVQPAIDIFSRCMKAYKVSSGYDINRRWQEGSPEPDFTLTGVFQPADDKALQFLAEGDRSKGAKVLHTNCKLDITDRSEQTGVEQDQIYIRDGGEVWRVVAPQDWSPYGSFYRYICVRYLDSKGHKPT